MLQNPKSNMLPREKARQTIRRRNAGNESDDDVTDEQVERKREAMEEKLTNFREGFKDLESL